MANDGEGLTEEELATRVQAILDSDGDESTKILQLHDLGYTNTQIHQEFGFKKSTVYKVLPVKPAKGRENNKVAAGKSSQTLMKLGSKDIIPPEETFRGIQLQDGDYKRGFVDGMGTLIMAARYNQILAASQSEILTNQIKIMEESRKGSVEMAQEAAAQAAAEVGAKVAPKIDQLASQMAASSGQNPMQSLMMSMMSPAFQQAGQQVAKLFGGAQPGQSQPGGEQQPQPGGQQQVNVQQPQPSWSPPNVEEHSIDEWEG